MMLAGLLGALFGYKAGQTGYAAKQQVDKAVDTAGTVVKAGSALLSLALVLAILWLLRRKR